MKKTYAGGIGEIPVSPGADGKTHINVYSMGKTELGRRLTNFSKNDLDHPVYGWFQSMEAFWYWCSTGKKHEAFRPTWGMGAKTMGRPHPKVMYPEFEADIISGIHAKLAKWPDLYTQLMESSLPLTHYYITGTSLRPAPSFNFVLDELELLRSGKPLMYPLATA